jgi:valyl-tRNA synthetase
MAGYDWREVEPKWQRWWHDRRLYEFDQSEEAASRAYLIDNPPRYASGSLHVGHAVHYTHIDMAARYKRMTGHNVMFPLCFDTNGIPIEERVERNLGVTRLDVDRHEFIEMCREFAGRNIEDMTQQFAMLGCSMDPSVYYQTDAPYYRRVTQISFLKMFRKGHVYKGTFPVNWCPRCLTALADAEVEYRDRDSTYNNIVFKVDETGEEIIIATTRPELLCTCQVVALHPTNPRAGDLVGKHMITPLYGRRVPVIADEAVDPEKGTGTVMICSIGDKEDLQWILKHGLDFEMAIDEQGRMTERAGKYEGMTVAEARGAIISDLRAAGLLRGQEPTLQSVGSCWRCHTTVEFLRRPQWFLKSVAFRDAVLRHADELNWYPPHMRQRLDDWVNSLEWDWVISRQRYFATPIPVWECECGEVVPANEEQCYVDPTSDSPPVAACPKCGGKLVGCQDVFDTWMDSSISPPYIAFWKRDDSKFQALYPAGLRPQASDIIRTWAYYSLLRSHLLLDSRPWNDIMIDGFILSPDGTPMHASLGNAIDPIETLQEYGGDVFRYLASLCALGQDSNFRPPDLVRGRRFLEKFWNVQQFIRLAVEKAPDSEMGNRPENILDRWALDRLSRLIRQVRGYYDDFDFPSAMREIQYFVWHELADHYVELVKSRVYSGDDPSVASVLRTLGLATTKLLAPILPHITEEVYQQLYRSFDGAESVHVSSLPEAPKEDPEARAPGEFAKEVAAAVRRWKSEKGISLNRPLSSVEIITRIGGAQKASSDIKAAIAADQLEIIQEDPTLRQEPICLRPNHATIGPRFRKATREVISRLAEARPAEVAEALKAEGWTIELSDGSEATLTGEDVQIEYGWVSRGHAVNALSVADSIVVIRRD